MLKTLTEAHDLAKSLRPLQTAMLLRAPETSEYVTSSLVAACRRVAANESIPKHDTVLNVGSRLLKWSSMQKLHHHTSFPSSPHLVTPLLEEFYPALLVCMVDDLLREGRGECEPLEPTLDTLTAAHAEARALVLQYMQDCVSTEAVDSESSCPPFVLCPCLDSESSFPPFVLCPCRLQARESEVVLWCHTHTHTHTHTNTHTCVCVCACVCVCVCVCHMLRAGRHARSMHAIEFQEKKKME